MSRVPMPPVPPTAWRVLMLAAMLAATESPAGGPPAPPGPGSIPAVDAIVVVHDFGEFRIRFYREEVPNHVAQFLSLAAEGYYDRLSFHRVIPELLIQTGDPDTYHGDRDHYVGQPGYRLPPEPTDRPILRGSVAMAWDTATRTAATQWFVSLGEFPEMREGTVIGEVVEGMDVVDRISQVSTFVTRVPLNRVGIEKIRLVPVEAAGDVAAESSARAEGGAPAISAD